MSKVFRWLGPGVLTDRVGGQAVQHMGRREGPDGKLIDGDIVREHTVDPKKLAAWVKAGLAEYVNLAENAVDSLRGGKQSEESARGGQQVQAAQDQADAAARLAALAKLRRTLSGPLFSDEDRKKAEEKFAELEPARIRDALAQRSGLADVAFAMQGLGGGPISLFGSDRLKQRYLPGVGTGEKIAAFAMSEPDGGSDIAAMTTTARRDGAGFVLEGIKTWISNAGLADFYVVFARFDDRSGRDLRTGAGGDQGEGFRRRSAHCERQPVRPDRCGVHRQRREDPPRVGGVLRRESLFQPEVHGRARGRASIRRLQHVGHRFESRRPRLPRTVSAGQGDLEEGLGERPRSTTGPT